MTPGGKPQKGDHIVNRDTGEHFVVIERMGDDMLYACRIRRFSGQPFSDGRPTHIMTEVAWWLRNGYQVIDRKKVRT